MRAMLSFVNADDVSKVVVIRYPLLSSASDFLHLWRKANLGFCRLLQTRRGDKGGAVVLLTEMKCGELLNQMPKTSGGDRRSEAFKIRPASKFGKDESEIETPKPKLEVAKELGFSKDQVSHF